MLITPGRGAGAGPVSHKGDADLRVLQAANTPPATALCHLSRPDTRRGGSRAYGTIGGVTALKELSTTEGTATLRRAFIEDVPSIVELLSDDPLSTAREGCGADDGLEPYLRAFAAVDADPAHQVSFIPGLSRRGALRAQVEAVRVRADQRNRFSTGLGFTASHEGFKLELWSAGSDLR